MTIDTSKEAVERLRRNDERLHAMIEKLVDAGAKCVAERDAQTARADAAEAREKALLSTYDAERKAMVENVALKAEVARLTAELTALRAKLDAHKLRGDNHWETMRCIYRIATKEGDLQAIIQHITDAGQGYTEDPEETLRRYQTELAETKAELSALRAGQAALVTAAYEAAAQVIDDTGDGATTKALGTQICCSGHHCGCQGANVGLFLQHLIRALTPDDATAALDAKLLAERNKVRREVHDAIADYPRVAPDEAEWTRYDDQIAHSQQIILAMIEPEGK